MDIKENFYSKLQQIREEYLDETSGAKARKDNKSKSSWSAKDIKKYSDNHIQKDWKKREGKKAQKKAVTGLDEEQLDELRGKGTVDKKEMQAHIRKKHDTAWEKTQEIRKEKKSAGPADTKDMDKYRNRLAKMHNKLDKESVDESVAGLALGTLAGIPLAVAGMKSGVIPKAVDKTSAMLKKLKKKIKNK